MQGSKRQGYRHRALFPSCPLDRRIRRTVVAIVLIGLAVGFIVQGCRGDLKLGCSFRPSSGARFCLVIGSRSFSDTPLVTGANAGDFTFAGPSHLLPDPSRPGFSQSNHFPVASADSTISFVPLNACTLGDATAFGKDAKTGAGDRSLGNANPRTAASDLDRLLEALILAAPEGEGCKAAPDVPTDTSGFYFTKMTVTAYCPLKCCCGRYADSFTASGHKIQPGQGERFAAAPRQYPFGTMFEVPGYGMAECRDRGGAIKGNKLDLYFDTHTEARAWGIKRLLVKVTDRF